MLGEPICFLGSRPLLKLKVLGTISINASRHDEQTILLDRGQFGHGRDLQLVLDETNTTNAGLGGAQTLKHNENTSPDNRNKVERKVNEVTDNGLRRKALEGALDDLSELLDRVVARSQFTAFADNAGGVS